MSNASQEQLAKLQYIMEDMCIHQCFEVVAEIVKPE